MPKNDRYFMNLALDEARRGLGRTSPNPCVGAIIVKNGAIIGRGYHKKAGTPHAEVHALNDAGENALGATIYVTLEPCSHTGRTPPCCEAVAKAGITRVVIGMMDPNPLVDGRGATYLRDRNIEVVIGVCETECFYLNRPFVKLVRTGNPWMIMKAGVSLDGKLNYQRGQSGWITGSQSKQRTHELRNQVDGIMVGSSTVMIDNPSLTTRLSSGEGQNPSRIILDTNLRTSLSSKVYDKEVEGSVYVFCGHFVDGKRREIFEKNNVNVISVSTDNGVLCLEEVIKKMAERELCSVLVEGGALLHGEMLKQRLFDYAYLFYGPVFAGTGGVSLVEGYTVSGRENAICLKDVRYTQLGEDMMVEGAFSSNFLLR